MKPSAITLCLLMSTSACGKKAAEPPATKEPVTQPTEAPTDKPVVAEDAGAADDVSAATAPTEAADTAAPAVAETEADIAAQCARILDKNWKAMAPAYEKLGVPVTAELESAYRETSYETKRFLEVCPTVSKVYRDCVEAAALPIESADACRDKVAKDEKQLGRPPIPGPKVNGRTPPSAINALFERPAASDAAKAEVAAKLPGTWKNEGAFGTTVWTIGADAQVSEVETRNGTAKEPKTFGIALDSDTTATIKYSSNDQTRGFHMLSDSEFLCQGNLMWKPSFMGDGTTFKLLMDFDAVFYDGGKCEVVTQYGNLLPATCAFAERDGKRWFDVSYQVPGKVRWGSDDPEPTTGNFLVSGAYLLPKKLLDSKFVKQ